jgi:hypothetical protein
VLIRLVALSSLAYWSALAAADVPKQPTGKWVAEYGEDKCLLSRSYGTDADPLILTLRQMPTDLSVRVIVFTSGTKGESSFAARGHLTFGGEKIGAIFSAYDSLGKPVRRIEAGVMRTYLLTAVQSGIVSVDLPGEVDESFAVPELGPALDVLSDCALKLGAAWGIPIEQQKRMKTAPKLLGMPFSYSDFPLAALRKEMNGKTEVRITIDQRGRPVDCVPLKSTPDPVFARTSCNVLLKRAHFKPARDVDGRSMKSFYVQSVVFTIAM